MTLTDNINREDILPMKTGATSCRTRAPYLQRCNCHKKKNAIV